MAQWNFLNVFRHNYSMMQIFLKIEWWEHFRVTQVYTLKDNFLFSDVKFAKYLTKIKSEKSTFVFKSPENINHADKNYYQINKYNSKNSTCREINFIKICQEIALKFCFWKNVVLYEIYSKKSRMANTYVHVLYFSKLK